MGSPLLRAAFLPAALVILAGCAAHLPMPAHRPDHPASPQAAATAYRPPMALSGLEAVAPPPAMSMPHGSHGHGGAPQGEPNQPDQPGQDHAHAAHAAQDESHTGQVGHEGHTSQAGHGQEPGNAHTHGEGQ